MKFCPKCGNSFDGWFHMCPENCGYSVELESTEELEEEIIFLNNEIITLEENLENCQTKLRAVDRKGKEK